MYTECGLLQQKLKGVLALSNQQGIIPLAEESLESFSLRAQGLVAKNCASSEELERAYALTQKLFDMEPRWVSVFQSDQHLSAWEAAATWQERGEGGAITSTIQLRKGKKWSRFYPVEEVIAHELVHAVRGGLAQQKFEEILAYRTSSSRWRRWWGPLFSRTWEVRVFIAFLLLSLLVQWGDLFWEIPSLLMKLTWLPWIGLGVGVIRLTAVQRVFHRCLERVGNVMGDPHRALAILVRLTDREIEALARCSVEEVRTFAKQQKGLRWQMIRERYF